MRRVNIKKFLFIVPLGSKLFGPGRFAILDIFGLKSSLGANFHEFHEVLTRGFFYSNP